MKHQLLALAVMGISVIGLARDAGAAPEFYPNEHYKRQGVEKVDRDVAECTAQANRFIETSGKAERPARGALRSSARGAATGALAGAIIGENVGRTTGAGAAIGGVKGAREQYRQRGEGNPDFQRYASLCLEEKGYRVIGWK